MNTRVLMYAGLALLVIGIVAGVYYLIPGFHHIIGFSLKGAGTDTYAARPLHAIAGFVVAVVGAVLLFFARPKKAVAA